MDNEALEQVLVDAGKRQSWIVLWGIPEHSPDQDQQVFDGPIYDHGFPRNPKGLKIGDILFVHRIRVSKIMYVGEVISLPRKSSAQEIESEPWREKWSWSVATKNLTPEYGSKWRKRGEKTFDLSKRYNELHPNEPVKISAIMFGTHVRIPRAFAEFLIGNITVLK
jgi:hypothetical protein